MLFIFLLASAVLAATTDEWQSTFDRVVPAVVSIRVNVTRGFDSSPAANAVATGFVVDAERGIILTNRHVVGPGPAVAEAVFQDNEEVDLQAIYRDPVHDFGFYRFDPSQVRYLDVVALDLFPEGARVGADIRIVGSDAGEKISILPGILALLDRPAPDYGRGAYNDFNTFYYQAASGTSGGSSGSPVLDGAGRVIALNAGSRRGGASSYFLPLDRVARALDLVRQDRPVTRGTLQTVFVQKGYDEVRRLGLSEQTEARVRAAFPDGKGLLVVEEVVPAGPASGVLRPGDVLISVNGRLLNAFVPLESVLDDGVGGVVHLDMERGGSALALDVPVGDLHAITPSEYLEVGGGVLHRLSYQQARSNGVPAAGVVVTADGYVFGEAGISAGSVLTAIGSQPVADLDAVEAALAALPDRARVPVRFFDLGDTARQQVAVITMDRQWNAMRRCAEQAGGSWPCRESAAPPPAPDIPAAHTTPLPGDDRPSRLLAPSLVQVAFDVPFRTEGVYSGHFRGTGIVVDAQRGWVVVDRDTVPVALGDVTITFGASVEIPGRVVWLHPVHNLAVIAYDPALLGDTPVKAVTLGTRSVHPGDRVWHVGLSFSQQIVSRRTRVMAERPLDQPLANPPFFRPIDIEVLEPADMAPSMGGVLADRKGRVVALWASYVDLSGKEPSGSFEGLPAEYIAEALEALRAGRADPWPTLGTELQPLTIIEARNRGLSDAEARILEEHDPSRRQVLSVVRRVAGTPAADLLRDGDLLLSADGQPVTRFREVESRVLKGSVALRVLRDGQVVDVALPAVPLSAEGTTRVLLWAGSLLHAPHAAVALDRGIPSEGVYVAWYWYGSPAARYHLRATRRITEVDGLPTPDLDAFLAAVTGRPDRAALRVTTVDLYGKEEVTTLKLDLLYWPTEELVRDGEQWRRIVR